VGRFLRILLLANAMNTLSGGDKRFVELSRRWAKLGHLVTVMTTPVGCEICRKERLEATYLILPFRFVDKLNQITCNLIRTLLASVIILKKNADVVYSTSDFLNDMLPALLLRRVVHWRSKLKWVALTFYLIPPPWRRKGELVTNIVAYFLQRVSLLIFRVGPDLVITNTSLLRDELRRIGVAKPIEALPNGIDAESIKKTPASDRLSDAVFVARMKSSKGAFDAILVWEQVCRRLRNAQLAMIGAGDVKTTRLLQNEIHKRNLESNVALLGFANSRTVYALMKSSKLLIYMDTESGWGITICEAMGCGLPVIAYDLPAFREVYGDAIDLIPIGDVRRFSKTVLNVLTNDDLRVRRAQKAREAVQKYDWDQIARDELLLLEKIQRLDGQSPRSSRCD